MRIDDKKAEKSSKRQSETGADEDGGIEMESNAVLICESDWSFGAADWDGHTHTLWNSLQFLVAKRPNEGKLCMFQVFVMKFYIWNSSRVHLTKRASNSPKFGGNTDVV